MAVIAIIDDDPDILDASSLILTSKGFEVITATNPEDGYKIVKENSPDLIILDVMMNEPDDGFFLAQKFRKEKIKTPILMYTSVSKATGMEYGKSEIVPVDEFVEKPISPEELLEKVEKLLCTAYGGVNMLVFEKNALSEEIEELVKQYGTARSSLLEILQAIQRKHKYISDFAQQEVARLLNIHPVEVYSVISFYSFLHSKPRGRNIVRLCRTISCDMTGQKNIENAVKKELGIKFGETTKDRRITLEYTNCLGMCDQGSCYAC